MISKSIDNLMSYKWIKDKVGKSELSLIGMHFSIGDCSISQLENSTKKFRIITD